MAARCQGYDMLERLLDHLPAQSDWCGWIAGVLHGRDAPVGVHLAVFVEPYLEAILDGRKTVESRFALHRCAPYGQVETGDVILLKRSGGPVVGIARAANTDFRRLGPGDLESIRCTYADELFATDDDFWTVRADKRYATLIGLEETLRIDEMVVEKRDRRGWVTYERSRPSEADLFA